MAWQVGSVVFGPGASAEDRMRRAAREIVVDVVVKRRAEPAAVVRVCTCLEPGAGVHDEDCALLAHLKPERGR